MSQNALLIYDLIPPRFAWWSVSIFSQSHSNMAAGTAVMHLPSTRSTVKKEEPARRVQKIQPDEVREVIVIKHRDTASWKTRKVDHVVLHDDIFWSKAMTFYKPFFVKIQAARYTLKRKKLIVIYLLLNLSSQRVISKFVDAKYCKNSVTWYKVGSFLSILTLKT